MEHRDLTFIDLFAGAGALSEGFVRAGFRPVAHVELDQAACNTLKTRQAYHWLKNAGRLEIYEAYLKGKITRNQLYLSVPDVNVHSVINAEIGSSYLKKIFAQIDILLKGKRPHLIVGGPPCQAYSLVGRSRAGNRMQGDKRNYLYLYYAKFLERYKPKYFIFENVTGLLSAKSADGARYFDRMRRLFRDKGYETEYQVLSADNHGVLQTRKRIILVGRRGKKSGFYPEPEAWRPDVNVREVLCDLPSIKAGGGSVKPCRLHRYKRKYLYTAGIRNDQLPVTFHGARPHTIQDREIYRIAVNKWNKKCERLDYNDLPARLQTHRNRRSFRDRFKVVAAELPASHTVVAHISKDGHYYIHPDIKQNRSLTPREAARLQTFPDDYFFESISETPGRTAAYRQIGNAVPVLLAEKIAQKLLEIW